VNGNILSIIPYRVLPATSGGHLGIIQAHHALGNLCKDHLIGTMDNAGDEHYSFDLHRIFSTGPERYIPYRYYRQMKRFAKAYDISCIWCDHPYMMPTALAVGDNLRLPVYMRSHNIESDRFRTLGKKWWRLMFWFEQYAMRSATGVFFVTEEDAVWAQQHYKLPVSKCHVFPFGTTMSAAPAGHEAAKQQLASEWSVSADKPWLYFLGALDYYPNIQAVEFIVNEVMPRLDKAGEDYQVFIAGKNLPQELQQKIAGMQKIKYLGFIPDIDQFLKACDVMLNPVLLGGGIKTKAVEALAYNKTVVSAHSGAAGLIREACGEKLLVAADNDWDDFVAKTTTALQIKADVPQAFFDNYNWDKLAEKALRIMQTTSAT
jgi:hypothetical protein